MNDSIQWRRPVTRVCATFILKEAVDLKPYYSYKNYGKLCYFNSRGDINEKRADLCRNSD